MRLREDKRLREKVCDYPHSELPRSSTVTASGPTSTESTRLGCPLYARCSPKWLNELQRFEPLADNATQCVWLWWA